MVLGKCLFLFLFVIFSFFSFFVYVLVPLRHLIYFLLEKQKQKSSQIIYPLEDESQ